MVIWAFGHVNKGSKNLWQKLEHDVERRIALYSVQNQCIICMALVKNNLGSNAFWKTMGLSLSQLDIMKSKGKHQDIANLSWIFMKIGYSEPNFWKKMEQAYLLLESQARLIDVAQVAYCFQQAEQGSPTYWKAFERRLELMKIDSDVSSDSIVIIAFVMHEKNLKSKTAWKNLITSFLYLLQKGLLHEKIMRLGWHRFFFKHDPKIWDSNVENFYTNELDFVSKNHGPKYMSFMKDLAFVATSSGGLGSVNFWQHIMEQFTGLLKHPNLMNLLSGEDHHEFGKVIFCIMNAWLRLKDQEKLNKFTLELTRFYEENQFFKLSVNQPKNLIYILYPYMLYDHTDEFFSTLEKNQQYFKFTVLHFKYLLQLILCKNGILLSNEKYKMLDNIHTTTLSKTENESQISALLIELVHLLFVKFATPKEFLDYCNKTVAISGADIVQYIDLEHSKNLSRQEVKEAWNSIFSQEDWRLSEKKEDMIDVETSY